MASPDPALGTQGEEEEEADSGRQVGMCLWWVVSKRLELAHANCSMEV